MTAGDNFEALLQQWLHEAAPMSAPADVHGGAMERARRAGQRRSWWAGVRNAIPAARISFVLRASATVVLTLVLSTALLVWVGRQPEAPVTPPEPTPTATPTLTVTPLPSASPGRAVARLFGRPFSYVVPTWDAVSRNPDPREAEGIGFVAGDQGVFVVAPLDPVVHPCPLIDGESSRIAIRRTPAEFLEDMQRIAGLNFSDPVEGTFDGRPALFTERTAESRTCGSDLHSGAGIGSELVDIGSAGRSIVLDVDGRLIFIDVWADTDDGLAEWLPIASEFVNSIQFMSRP